MGKQWRRVGFMSPVRSAVFTRQQLEDMSIAQLRELYEYLYHKHSKENTPKQALINLVYDVIGLGDNDRPIYIDDARFYDGQLYIPSEVPPKFEYEEEEEVPMSARVRRIKNANKGGYCV